MNSQSSTKAVKRGKPKRTLAQREQTVSQAHLVQTVGRLAAEVKALQQKLTQIEQRQEKYHVPQSLAELGPHRLPPPGQTAMQAIMGKLETDESLEDLLSQLKDFEGLSTKGRRTFY